MNRPKKKPSDAKAADQNTNLSIPVDMAGRGTRETIESIVIAIILAFLFRAFEAEAFVIPTGSMAPTLQGRHIDIQCDQCGYWFRTGASCENPDSREPGFVMAATCPICRYPKLLQRDYASIIRDNARHQEDDGSILGSDMRRDMGHDFSTMFNFFDTNQDGRLEPSELNDIRTQLHRNANHDSFSGDRILVNKFVYEFGHPRRWDVIVFKYPGNAKQNYIKRLIGLPNETIMIRHGDIYVLSKADEDAGQTTFRIARKPPHKIKAMLQLVDDTNHIGKDLIAVGWPSRWQEWSQDEDRRSWTIEGNGSGPHFVIDGNSVDTAWLRYRHIVPHEDDWTYDIPNETRPTRLDSFRGQLISDYYAYNDMERNTPPFATSFDLDMKKIHRLGLNWVGDLGVEYDVEVKSKEGTLLLDLVEGGVHYTCEINISTGQAELSIDGGAGLFIDAKSKKTANKRIGSTNLRGPGKYRLRFSNVDNGLTLWINENVVKFDGPAHYRLADIAMPSWSADDPGDAEPAGIGSRGVQLVVTRLRVLRDVYYTQNDNTGDPTIVRNVFEDPTKWNNNPLFSSRQGARFTLGEDQFFPMGDNSPQSSDARYWSSQGIEPYVDRSLLTGKALMIYWPHPWNRPIKFQPNFKRIQFIR